MSPEASGSAPSDRLRFEPQPMVEWFNPWLLLTTGLQVLVWGFVGQGRAMEEAPRSFDIPAFTDDDLWFDYAADVGDGWNSTFAIASLLAQDRLDTEAGPLPHGRFLLLGGDAVYPVPTQRSYLERFVGPYETALPPSSPPRTLLAIPGNHDWYDGLVSFSRQFTQHRRVGAWRTAQSQSYFALQLPHRWWLWAMDVFGGSEMDWGQRRYFQRAAERLAPGDRVILVAAQPDWIEEQIRYTQESHFEMVEKTLIVPRGATVHLWLAGNLHHYRRHERVDGAGASNPDFQRITSGGGGAYLSPTHRPGKRSVVIGDHEFVRKTSFPTTVTSFRLSFLDLAFAVRNWKFGLFPMGVLYWLLTWVRLPTETLTLRSWLELAGQPGTLFWILMVLVGFWLYADGTRPWFRWFGGLPHGMAHVLVATIVTGQINATFLGAGSGGIADYVAANILNFLAGVLVGPTVFGLYLFLALNLFGLHGNEAFSGLRIEDYKHFLRLHITRTGALEIYPIGIQKIPRRHQRQGRFFLIERPIVIRGRTSPGEADREAAG